MRAPRMLAVCAALAAFPLAAQAQTEFRVVGFGMPAKRSAALDANTAGAATTTMGGGQLSLRGSWCGVAVGAVGGSFTAQSGSAGGGGKVAVAEARIQLGPRIVALEGGYSRHVVNGLLGTTSYSYFSGGAASLIDIGTTGLTVRLSGAVYFEGQGVTGVSVSGHEIVSLLEYQLGRTPLVVNVGYRGEIFTVTSGGVKMGDAVNGIVVGGGLKLGH